MTAVIEAGIAAGIHQMTDEAYHRDPVPGRSLSSTGARKLLQPGGPAKYRWELDHPAPPKREFDLGHAAHKLVLGAGPDFKVIDAKDYKTKAAQEARKAAHAAGQVPLLTHEHEQVQAMADAIRQHPVASALFDPACGDPEQTLIWQDPETGVWRRARLDWLPRPGGRRLIVADYKTCITASREAIAKSVANYGYHCQQPWYLDGVTALDLDDQPAMVFVFQEKTPPYLINVVELEPDDVQAGRDANQRAIRIFADCLATGHWPGYGDDITPIRLPRWANTFEENL